MNERASADFGAIERQIVWNRLIGLVEEQAQTLIRAAFSQAVRESGDLSAGVFDRRGAMVAQAITGTPGHVNSMAEAVPHFLAEFPLAEMQDGDHFITNDPWIASGHLHDITVVSPVFRAARPIGFFACTCHQVDIGGMGQGPDGRSVFEEGLYIPPIHLARAGKPNGDLLRMIRANVRQPRMVEGDVLSYVSFFGGEGPSIYLADILSGRKSPVVTSGSLNTSPSFSPDGRRIAFARGLGANIEIFTCRLDGSDDRLRRVDIGCDRPDRSLHLRERLGHARRHLCVCDGPRRGHAHHAVAHLRGGGGPRLALGRRRALWSRALP